MFSFVHNTTSMDQLVSFNYFTPVLSHTLSLSVSQESSTSCPELSIPEGYSCLSSPDCTVLECLIPANNVLVNGTANITLDRCDDPPLVNFRMQWLSDEGLLGLQNSFTESGDVLIGEGRIRATVERNLTTLAFSVSQSHDSTQFVCLDHFDNLSYCFRPETKLTCVCTCTHTGQTC